MENKISQKAYKEVLLALQKHNELFQKLPIDLKKHIKSQSSKYRDTIKLDESKDILIQISKEALSLFCHLYLKYGELDDAQKERIKQILITNELNSSNITTSHNIDDAEESGFDLNNIKNPDEAKIIKKVQEEAKKEISKYISEDELGYKHYLYLEMKKKLDILGIKWTPFKSSTIQ